jgi:lysophospholipase L1-like esterase
MRRVLQFSLRLVRDGWIMLGVTCVYLLVANLLAAMCLGLIQSRDSSLVAADWGPRVPASFSAPRWWSEYNRELGQLGKRWYPYVGFRFATPGPEQYINVTSQCFRRTWESHHQSESRLFNIFVFGGSTIWGQGARDDYTIPSFVAKDLADEGLEGVRVINFGQLGYVNTQETIALLLELRQGNIPDLVIFFDGVNDTFSALQNGFAGSAQNLAYDSYEFEHPYRWLIGYTLQASALRRLTASIFPTRLPSHPIANTAQNKKDAEAILKVYFTNIRLVSEAASRLGFGFLFYWQPETDTKPRLTAYEQEAARLFEDRTPGYRKLAVEVHRLLNESLTNRAFAEPRMIDLSAIFDRATGSCFIDEHHTTERCNAIIAERIAQDATRFLMSRKDSRSF